MFTPPVRRPFPPVGDILRPSGGARKDRGLWRGPAAVAAAALLLLLAACGDPRSPDGGAPNVLVIVLDTVRGDHVSLNGYERPTTPRLAEFAARATTFTDAWSPSSWSPPAHASIFTGLRPEHHGLMQGKRMALLPDVPTLAEILSAAGWRTGCFSANPFVSADFGLTRGFEVFVDHLEKPGVDYPTAPRLHAALREFVGDAMRRRAADGRPWFAFLNNMEPHLTYRPVAEWEERFLSAERPNPARLAAARGFKSGDDATAFMLGRAPIDEAGWRLLGRLYDAEIAWLDDAVGRLLAELEAEGAFENTIVVVLSDHGENLGDHGLADHLFGLNRALLHVPLLIRAPGAFDDGHAVAETVRTEDLLPTILELAGRPIPEGLDGTSLLGDRTGRIARAVLGPNTVRPIRERFPEFEESRLGLAIRSVYDGRWHLTERSDGLVKLFDVQADPREHRDLAGERPDEVKRLTALLPNP